MNFAIWESYPLCLLVLSNSSWNAWVWMVPPGMNKAKTKSLKKCLLRGGTSCDISQWNPLTKKSLLLDFQISLSILVFSAYLHVCLSLFSIFFFFLVPLSPISSVSVIHLFVLRVSSVCLLSLQVADWLCSSDCPLVDPLHLCTFCVCLLSLLIVDSFSVLYILGRNILISGLSAN